LALAIGLAFVFIAPVCKASALTVPAGCDAPSPANGGRKFYVDPVHGSMDNDGTQARPWLSLAEVVKPARKLFSTRNYTNYTTRPNELEAVNPIGLIKPGDTLVLLSGDHGDVDLRGLVNKDFIYIIGETEGTAIINSMRVVASSHWYFKGLKFQGARPEKTLYGGLVEVSGDSFHGPSDNIVFESNSFSAQDDVSRWSDGDWVSKPWPYALNTSGSCSTLISNHFYNVRNAAAIGGNNSLFEDNIVEYFGNDSLEIMASNLTIRHNLMREGHHSSEEALHADGIQGWTVKGATNRNVLIDGNTIINANSSDNNYLQGISIFDGLWDGLRITNNVIITNAWHGIALYGVDNAEVINNTVLPFRPAKLTTWINIHPAKNKRPSSNVVVRNNIAGEIIANGVNIKVDHNITSKGVSAAKAPKGFGATDSAEMSDNSNGVALEPLFVSFDRSQAVFDLRLAPDSVAIKTGSSDGAPAFDRDGRPRKAPIDIGAYAR
jgi:parallel beta-helix repeat protein